MLPGIFSGAVAGLLAGAILGGLSYSWEYYFGYELMNKIYRLPESVIDFNRE